MPEPHTNLYFLPPLVSEMLARWSFEIYHNTHKDSRSDGLSIVPRAGVFGLGGNKASPFNRDQYECNFHDDCWKMTETWGRTLLFGMMRK